MSRKPTPTKSLPSGVFNVRDEDHWFRSELDELRKEEPDLPSRAEMMRRLIKRAPRKAKKAA